MLVRTFRLTDKFSNALLKLAIYVLVWLAQRMQDFRYAVENTLRTVLGFLQYLLKSLQALFITIFGNAAKSGRSSQQQIRQVMVQRAERAAISRQKDLEIGKVVEDPMIARNRSLSAITVILLIILITFLVASPNQRGGIAGNSGGIIPPAPINEVEPEIPTPSPTPTLASQFLSNVGGTLVFSVRQNGQDDIWALPVGSTNPIRLTDSLEDDRDPAWSPDGGSIAFTSRRDGAWNLYVIDLTEGQTRQLTFNQRYVGAPSWSPDGQFIVYEAYTEERGNIDLYLISREGEEVPRALTSNPYPDLEPSWSPQGRDIAYVSWRNGSSDILILNLDGQPEDQALNLTNTPDITENFPQWSPEGNRIAYTATQNGIDGIYVKSVVSQADSARLIGRGRMPAWNPLDGSSVYYTVPQGSNSAIYLGQVDNFGVGASAVAFQGQVADLDWTRSLHNITGFDPRTPPLYQENITERAGGRVSLVALNNVNVTDPVLSDTVNESFEALRQRINAKTGTDLLGTLESATWRRERLPEPGQERYSWHYTGRAISLPRDLVLQGNPTPIVVIREDTEIGTQWRVMARTAEQDGSQGEPLRVLPWDFGARFADDPEAFEQGGREMSEIPDGYYVDLTQIMTDFGWERLPANRAWRANFAEVLFWQFQKTDNLVWRAAMLQVYTEQEVEEFELGIVPPPATPLPSNTPLAAEETPRGARQGSATPIPLITATP